MSDRARGAGMTPDRWAKIEEIFTDALARPVAERPGFIEASCGEDAELRADVEKLLAEHGRDPGLLDTPAAWLIGEAAEASEERIETVGPYRILRPLGRGGMGQVWLAEREAPGFRQLVALKVMRRGLDTDDLVARFRTERQILGRLNHPNIARLFDVGATDGGLPYFVMEYVDGVPILEFCDRERLTVPDRLRLFRTVCAAVQHAHRALVVHRDLKPHNILVTKDGTAKLLDFGIAKMLEPDGDDAGGQLTGGPIRILTPEYCAPEQIRGDPVTTACDVYALGILLYEVLSGRHPYRARQHDPGSRPSRSELERAALEIDPPPPSATLAADLPGGPEVAVARRTTPAQLQRTLAGDLDAIALKAMRKEPEARYGSALSLSEDVDRHLTGHAVRARAGTRRYRIRKFAARNRVAVATAMMVFLVLSASTVTLLYQSRRIRAESARVERERDKALQVRGFLLEMFGATGPDQPTGDTVTARQLLDRRTATLREAYAEDAEMRAEMMTVLAEGYEKLGLFDVAEPLARSALETRRGLFGGDHPDVAVSLNVLGWLLRERGDLESAERLLRESVAIGRRVFPAGGDPRLARALNDLGIVLDTRGEAGEVEALLRESLDMRRRLLGEAHVGVAVTASNLSVILSRKGDLTGALAMNDTALSLFRRLLGPDHQRTLIVQTNMASLQTAAGAYEDAVRLHRDILERRRRLFGSRHPSTVNSLIMLANTQMWAGQPGEAEPLLEEALAAQREPGSARPRDLAATLRVLGDVRDRAGRHDEALAAYEEGIAVLRRASRVETDELAVLLSRTAGSHERLGALQAADRAHAEALRVADRALGGTHTWNAAIRMAYAEFLLRAGRPDEAGRQAGAVEKILDEIGTPADDPMRRRIEAVRAAGDD